MTEHTKGPLALGKMGSIKGGPVHEFARGTNQSQLFLAMAGRDMSHEERDANAAHMVKCWNHHDRLVDALRQLVKVIGEDMHISQSSAKLYGAPYAAAVLALAQLDLDSPCS